MFAQDLPLLQVPIDGRYGKDFFLIHYIDQDSTSGFRDPFCGTKSYDGHLGHDFVIRSFRQMDSGVTVRAAHDGVVIKVVDGLFDRNKEDTVFGYGNYIVILHSSGLATVYAHLKRNSIRVRFGDRVTAGMPIAEVGSSGRSSDPHLHFELWFMDMLWWVDTLVDPFRGPCGRGQNRWQQLLPYDTSFAVLGSGLLDHNPTLGELKEHPLTQTVFRQSDTAVCFWIHLHGVRRGDSLRVEWIAPYNIRWFSYTTTVSRDHWYFYWWSYILVPSTGMEGIWTVRFYRNTDLVQERTFLISRMTTVADNFSGRLPVRVKEIRLLSSATIVRLSLPVNAPLVLVNSAGQVVYRGAALQGQLHIPYPLSSGAYWLRVGPHRLPVVIAR